MVAFMYGLSWRFSFTLSARWKSSSFPRNKSVHVLK